MKDRRGNEDTVYVLPVHRLAICTVPKAASTSIRWAVHASLGLAPTDKMGINRETDFWISPDEVERFSFPVVGVVREPIDRFLSACAWLMVKRRLTVSQCMTRAKVAQQPVFAHQAPMLKPVKALMRFDYVDEWWDALRTLAAYPLPPLEHYRPAPREKPTLSDRQLKTLRSIYEPDVELYASCS